MNSIEALDSLRKGNAAYVADSLNNDSTSKVRSELVSGQSPYAVILSCADSRVVPEEIFNANPGQLFVCRVAGNVANDSTVASIEYAVANLGTKLILVLGHESCGAVTAAIKEIKASPCLDHLLAQIKPAVDACESSDVNDVVRTNAQLVVDKLLAKSEILRSADGLMVVSGFYNLGSGVVDILD